MAVWDWDSIKEDIRKMTGRRAEHQLSSAYLLQKLTNYYQNVMPVDLQLSNWEGFYEATLSAGNDTLTPGVDVLLVKPPITVDGVTINVIWDWDSFIQKFPESQTYTASQPTDVLWYNGVLTFRPEADVNYAVKAPAIYLPAYGGSAPTRDAWADLLVAGTSLQILMTEGDSEAVKSISAYYKKMKTLVMRPEVLRMGLYRPVPRW